MCNINGVNVLTMNYEIHKPCSKTMLCSLKDYYNFYRLPILSILVFIFKHYSCYSLGKQCGKGRVNIKIPTEDEIISIILYRFNKWSHKVVS